MLGCCQGTVPGFVEIQGFHYGFSPFADVGSEVYTTYVYLSESFGPAGNGWTKQTITIDPRFPVLRAGDAMILSSTVEHDTNGPDGTSIKSGGATDNPDELTSSPTEVVTTFRRIDSEGNRTTLRITRRLGGRIELGDSLSLMASLAEQLPRPNMAPVFPDYPVRYYGWSQSGEVIALLEGLEPWKHSRIAAGDTFYKLEVASPWGEDFFWRRTAVNGQLIEQGPGLRVRGLGIVARAGTLVGAKPTYCRHKTGRKWYLYTIHDVLSCQRFDPSNEDVVMRVPIQDYTPTIRAYLDDWPTDLISPTSDAISDQVIYNHPLDGLLSPPFGAPSWPVCCGPRP